MKKILLIALSLLFLYGCGGASGNNFRYHHIIVTEFINHFQDDTLLVRVEAIERDAIYGTFRREYIYVYDDDNQLVSRSEYRIEVDGARELFHQQIFSQNKETRICFRDNDTIRFRQTIFNDKGDIIECYRRVSDWWEHSHERRLVRFDSDNQPIRNIVIDYIRQTTTIITFSNEVRGDTLVRRRYANGEFEEVIYTIQLGDNHTMEFFYNANNFLTMRTETTIDGEYETEVITYYDENAKRAGVVTNISTWVYRNGKIIEDISRVLFPDNRKTRWTTDYDERGNRVREVMEMWWD